MPQNEEFFIAAYVAAIVIYVLYGWSISRRRRTLSRTPPPQSQ